MVVKSREKKWVVREPGNPLYVRQLMQDLGIDEILANLLVQRGITNAAEAREFFYPSLNMLHNPFLMKDMDIAVERIHRALEKGEKIIVYGDYDVDGTSAVSLVYSFLKNLTDNIDYYIPDRYDDGYGISSHGIDWARERDCDLIVALDCGIKEVEEVAYAESLGIDIIICAHHLPGETLPPAVATLDPKRVDCDYPYDDLCGCGVGFKLVQGYALRYGIPFEQIEPLLDLVAVSIAADLVSVTGENRVLAYFGLKRLNENPRKGLLAMIKLSGLEKHKITIDDVVFKIGPRINAAGRMETGRIAEDLLTSESDIDAVKNGKVFFVFFFVFFCYVCMLILLYPFIGVYSASFTDGVNYLRWSVVILFVAVGFVQNIRIPGITIIIAAGHYKETLWRAILEASLNLGVSLLLVRRLGIIGVLLGGLASYLYRSTDVILYTASRFARGTLKKTGIRLLRNAVTSAVLIFVGLKVVPTEVSGWTQWFIWAAAVAVAVGIVLFAVNFIFEKQEFFACVKRLKDIIEAKKKKVTENNG